MPIFSESCSWRFLLFSLTIFTFLVTKDLSKEHLSRRSEYLVGRPRIKLSILPRHRSAAGIIYIWVRQVLRPIGPIATTVLFPFSQLPAERIAEFLD